MNHLSIYVSFIVGVLILIVGVYLCVKIVKNSVKEKGNTWKLDVTNSFLIIFHHGHCLIMEFLTEVVPDLYVYTGKWFCYTSKVINHYGNIHIVSYAMIIGLMKYILIIHWMRVIDIGEAKIKNIFFWVNQFYAGFHIVLHLIIEPNFYWEYDGFARTDRCLGDPKNNWSPGSNRTQIKVHMICNKLIESPMYNHLEYLIQYGRLVLCWAQVVFQYLTLFNIIEFLIYLRIFSYSRRQFQQKSGPKHRAAESNRINTLENRKLLVNAQVTGTLVFLEVVTMISITILLRYYKGTNFYNLIGAMVVYDVLLPYSFLMNTSHNKDRVVQLGWKNVFKNIIGKRNNSVENDPNFSNETKSKRKPLHKDKIPHKRETGDKIFTISPSKIDRYVKKVDNSWILDVPVDDEPSTSIGVESSSSDISPLSPVMLIQQEINQGENKSSSDDLAKTETEDEPDEQFTIEKGLVSKMIIFIEDEEKYIQVFKDFVSLQGHCRAGKEIGELLLEHEINYYDPPIKNQSKNRNSKHNDQSQDQIKSNSSSENLTPHPEGKRNLCPEQNLSLEEQQNYRRGKRQILLDKLKSYTRHDLSYESLKEELIDLEEGFM